MTLFFFICCCCYVRVGCLAQRNLVEMSFMPYYMPNGPIKMEKRREYIQKKRKKHTLTLQAMLLFFILLSEYLFLYLFFLFHKFRLYLKGLKIVMIIITIKNFRYKVESIPFFFRASSLIISDFLWHCGTIWLYNQMRYAINSFFFSAPSRNE